ncbi:replication factor C large subunit [Candidatus Bathyarchaeota archaeon]|nr:replication factor C large subunit [Candidatus Bathyarchaeota archaeon]
MLAAWAVKYRPKSLAKVIGNKETIQKLVDWVKSWDQGVPKKKAAFLYGPPGVGKTSTVEALAQDFQMELVEKNASDYRTEDAINRFAGLASQFGSLFGGKRIVLLDEIDGLTGTADRGGVKAITDVLKTAQCPIILTANSAYDPKFTNLRNYCLLLEFKKLPVGEIAEHLKGISENERIQADETTLKFIAQRSQGDVRSAVTDLQALAQGKEKLKYEDVSWLGYRDRQDTVFNVLRMIIYGKTCNSARQAANMSDVDVDMLFEWIYENIPDHLTDQHDLAMALDALSIADIYRGRIRVTRDWSLMRYVVDYMTAGVAMARQNSEVSGWIPFKFPSRIQMLSRSRAERATRLNIGKKIKHRCHVSAVRASKEVLPYLRIIFENNTEMAVGLAKWLDLDPEMIEYIAGSEDKAEAITRLLC